MNASPLKEPTAILPIAMSCAALALLIGWASLVGVSDHKDEGGPARLFQLLIVGQLPLMAMYAIRWLPRAPKQALIVLGLQVLAAGVAVGTVMVLEGKP
jgi:hypothetical protein